MQEDALQDPDSNQLYPLSEVAILSTLKFEDDSDADDVSILYLVETNSGLKGQFVDASGMYAVLNVFDLGHS